MRSKFFHIAAGCLVAFIVAGHGWCASTVENESPAASSKEMVLHLPGIAGDKPHDRNMVRGLIEGGFGGETQIYDWTEGDPGMDALLGVKRNRTEAQHVADEMAARLKADPNEKIFVTAHSGGCGIAVWALEDLPVGVMVQTVVLMSPALSPTYDLSAALKHVSGKLYVFSSTDDVLVLGTGTRLFGTIDGVKTDAAGRVGFEQPPAADGAQYAKLVSMPYCPLWTRFGNYGDHIGGMTRGFGKNVLAPLILQGKLPPTTMPTTMEAGTGSPIANRNR